MQKILKWKCDKNRYFSSPSDKLINADENTNIKVVNKPQKN